MSAFVNKLSNFGLCEQMYKGEDAPKNSDMLNNRSTYIGTHLQVTYMYTYHEHRLTCLSHCEVHIVPYNLQQARCELGNTTRLPHRGGGGGGRNAGRCCNIIAEYTHSSTHTAHTPYTHTHIRMHKHKSMHSHTHTH